MHDLYFAQGFAEGSDRLFQMDVTRRFVYGRLSEVLGRPALQTDIQARIVDVRGIVDRQWTRLTGDQRSAAADFARGVNAAALREPLPPQFRLLMYSPDTWTPKDSLAVSFATVLQLVDSWNDIVTRSNVYRAYGPAVFDALYPITDPKYDSPTTGHAPAPVPGLPNLGNVHVSAKTGNSPEKPFRGSNEWVAGANRTTTGRALLANDPHLPLGIPSVWYLDDLQAPGYHVAGATLAGTFGVVLGHNDHLAWGATNGTVSTVSVFQDTVANAVPRNEHFVVRFGPSETKTYYRTKHGFVFTATTFKRSALSALWTADYDAVSPLTTFDSLDRSPSIRAALSALSRYPGPPQNFVLAEDNGKAAYTLAGTIPQDPYWGRSIHPSQDPHGIAHPFAGVPFAALPHVDASRNAVAFTSNNRIYGAGYGVRLAAHFAPPYRAFEVRRMLRAKKRYSVRYFAAMQYDTLSCAEQELASDIVAAAKRARVWEPALQMPIRELAQWDGRFSPQSHGAVLAWEIRRLLVRDFSLLHFTSDAARQYRSTAGGSAFVALLRALRERPRGWVPRDDYDRFLIDGLRQTVSTLGITGLQSPWGRYGAVTIQNPLAWLGAAFWNGPTLQGDGDGYTVRVQTSSDSQSFRAVWDVGNWDAGGILIPTGESGQPGSPHYADLTAAFSANQLVALPFSAAAVRAATRATLTLSP